MMVSTQTQQGVSNPIDFKQGMQGQIEIDALSFAWFAELMNDAGYGFAILDRNLKTILSNEAGSIAIGKFLHSARNGKYASHSSDSSRQYWHGARAALAGRRSLLVLTNADQRIATAFSPLVNSSSRETVGVLVTIEKTRACDDHALWAYSRIMGLTPGEIRVLGELVAGLEPKGVAQRLNVSVTTIRTHIKSVLSKTGHPSIRELLLAVSRLPPVNASTQASFELGGAK